MDLQKFSVRGMMLLAGGILMLLPLSVSAADDEVEDVKVIERKPDESNPMYEIVKLEGGLFFRVPKDMTFSKQYGVISPISTEEYCLKKNEEMEKQIEALSKRIEILEGNAVPAPDKKNQTSL